MNCPTCGNTIEWKGNPFRPFCSERCKLLDLGAWVNEEYALPAEETNVPAESEIPEPSPTSEEKEIPIDNEALR